MIDAICIFNKVNIAILNYAINESVYLFIYPFNANAHPRG